MNSMASGVSGRFYLQSLPLCHCRVAAGDPRLADYAKNLKIVIVAINPNIHPNYPDDAPAKMVEKIKELGITFSLSGR